MTTTPAQLDTQVQGKAIYLEFVKSDFTATTQVLLMPEGQTTSHRVVPMTVYRRRLTAAQTRKTWKVSASPTLMSTLLSAASPLSDTEAIDRALLFITPLFNSLERNSYTLYKDPIVVEVTAEDLEFARNGKTPYKALARVWKSRKVLGFPKEYVHAVRTF